MFATALARGRASITTILDEMGLFWTVDDKSLTSSGDICLRMPVKGWADRMSTTCECLQFAITSSLQSTPCRPHARFHDTTGMRHLLRNWATLLSSWSPIVRGTTNTSGYDGQKSKKRLTLEMRHLSPRPPIPMRRYSIIGLYRDHPLKGGFWEILGVPKRIC